MKIEIYLYYPIVRLLSKVLNFWPLANWWHKIEERHWRLFTSCKRKHGVAPDFKFFIGPLISEDRKPKSPKVFDVVGTHVAHEYYGHVYVIAPNADAATNAYCHTFCGNVKDCREVDVVPQFDPWGQPAVTLYAM